MSSEPFTKRSLVRRFQMTKSRKPHFAFCVFSAFFVTRAQTKLLTNLPLAVALVDVPFWYVSMVYPRSSPHPFVKRTLPCPDISSIAASHLKPKTGRFFPLNRKPDSCCRLPPNSPCHRPNSSPNHS